MPQAQACPFLPLELLWDNLEQNPLRCPWTVSKSCAFWGLAFQCQRLGLGVGASALCFARVTPSALCPFKHLPSLPKSILGSHSLSGVASEE